MDKSNTASKNTLDVPDKEKIKSLFLEGAAKNNSEFVQLFTLYKNNKGIRSFLLKLTIDHPEKTLNLTKSVTEKFLSETVILNSTVELSQYLYFLEICLINTNKISDVKKNIVQTFLPLANRLINIYNSNAELQFVSNFSSCVDATWKILVIIFKDEPKDNAGFKFIEGIFLSSYEVLTADVVRYDIRQKSALIFVYVFQNGNDSLVKKLNLELVCPVYPNIHKNFHTISNKLKNNISGNVAFHTASANILTTMETEFLIETFHTIIDLSYKATSLPLEMIDISQTLSSIMRQFAVLNSKQFRPIIEKSLTFLCENVDHQIEMVRENTRRFLKVMIDNCGKFYSGGECENMIFVLNNINNENTNLTLFYNTIILVSTYMSYDSLLEIIPNLNTILLTNLANPTIQAIASNTYKSLMEKFFKETPCPKIVVEFWVKPILLRAQEIDACEKILHSALALNTGVFHELVPHLNNDQLFLLKCILFLRNNRTDLIDDNETVWKGLICKETLSLLALHQDSQVRLSALAVVVETKKSTEIYSKYDLNFLLSYINYNLAEDSPHVRKQMTSLYTKAFIRFSTSFKLINRELNKTQRDEYKRSHNDYRPFPGSFLKRLASNLFSGGNFARRSAALELILIVRPYVPEEDWSNCWNVMNLKLLLNLFHDSYESNKKMALEVLEKCPTGNFDFLDFGESCNYYEKCFILANEMNPNKSLTASYMFRFVINSPKIFNARIINTTLNTGVVVSNFNSRIATIKTLLNFLEYKINTALIGYSVNPLHGLILCITELLKTRETYCKLEENNDYTLIFETVVRCSRKVISLVFPVICNDSPEGYLPEGHYGFDNVSTQSSKAQMLLIFAWRTMKELTILLAEIIYQHVKVEGWCESNKLLKDEAVEFIHDMFIRVFIEAKHRGVFEQAFVGFSSICSTYWRFGSAEKKTLLKTWLTRVLSYCSGELDVTNLCATRRSAGLPFFLLSIVVTNPNLDSEYLKPIINCLIENAQRNSFPELQMHSFNCMRGLFRNTVLAEVVQPFVTSAVQTSIAAFNSRIWAVSNAALLLFSTLIVRIFGVQRTSDSENLTMKNKLSVRVFTMRYPTLLEYLLNILSEQVEGKLTDSKLVYPILLLITRLCPSHSKEHDTIILEHLNLIVAILKHPSHKIREIASRVLIAFRPNYEEVHNYFREIKHDDADLFSNNVLSSKIVQLLNLTSLNVFNHKQVEDFLQINRHFLKLTGVRYSHYTTALYMEFITKLLICHTNLDYTPAFETVLLDVAYYTDTKSIIREKNTVSRLKFNTSRLILLLLLTIKSLKSGKSCSFALDEIIYHLDSQNVGMKIYSLEMLAQLQEGTTRNENSTKTDRFIYESEKIPTIIAATFNHETKKFLTLSHVYVSEYLTNSFGKIEQTDDKNIILSSIKLLQYYPYVLICDSSEKVARNCDILLRLMTVNSEDIAAACVTCMHNLLLRLKNRKLIDFGKFVSVLSSLSLSETSDFVKMALSKLLKDLDYLFKDATILKEAELLRIYHIMMELIEDDNEDIRNTISLIYSQDSLAEKSGLKTWKPIPFVARRKILNLVVENLPEKSAISFVFGWSNRFFESQSFEVSQVFEKSDLNQFADNVPIMEVGLDVLQVYFYSRNVGSDLTSFILTASKGLYESLSEVDATFIPKSVIGSISEVLCEVTNLILNQRVDLSCIFESIEKVICEKLGVYLGVVYFLLRLFKIIKI